MYFIMDSLNMPNTATKHILNMRCPHECTLIPSLLQNFSKQRIPVKTLHILQNSLTHNALHACPPRTALYITATGFTHWKWSWYLMLICTIYCILEISQCVQDYQFEIQSTEPINNQSWSNQHNKRSKCGIPAKVICLESHIWGIV